MLPSLCTALHMALHSMSDTMHVTLVTTDGVATFCTSIRAHMGVICVTRESVAQDRRVSITHKPNSRGSRYSVSGHSEHRVPLQV